jgi:hypothetical protein
MKTMSASIALAVVKGLFYVLSQPYILVAILAVVMYLFASNYGFLGAFVLISNPVFAVLTLWAIFLIFIKQIGPIVASYMKSLTKAIGKYIKKNILHLRMEGESNEDESSKLVRDFVGEVQDETKKCIGMMCGLSELAE